MELWCSAKMQWVPAGWIANPTLVKNPDFIKMNNMKALKKLNHNISTAPQL